jgi:hypothetical protein
VVFRWLFQDNLLYNQSNRPLKQAQPFQFIMCGAIQLTVDILLLTQITFYGNDNYSTV